MERPLLSPRHRAPTSASSRSPRARRRAGVRGDRRPLPRAAAAPLPPLPRPASAEDAVQQTFINAHAALIGGNAPLALKPWLYRIARNAALNIARVPQIEPIPDELLEPDELEDVFAPARDVRPHGRRRARAARLAAQVIVRHAFDGDSHERIAADLGLSAGAIRQLAYRARGTLRQAA